MKVAKKISCVITCSILIIIIMFGNVSCAAIYQTYLDGKTYNSIEELHEDFIATMKQEAHGDEDYFPREIVKYFPIEDVIAVVMTFSKNAYSDKLVQNELFVYFVKEINNQYELLTPILGLGLWTIIQLGYEYTLGGNVDYYASEVKVNNENRSICFLYKDINETRNIYFDNVKTNEIEMTNPFDGTQFILCYGLSNPDKLGDKCSAISERHSVELK